MVYRPQYNFAILFMVALLLACVSAVMLLYWFEEQKAQIETIDRMTIASDLGSAQTASEAGDLNFYSNLSRISLIIVLACFSLLCFCLALFWRQHYVIQRQRLRFQRLYDSAPVMYQSLDAAHQISSVNLTECDVLQMTQVELLRRDFLKDIVAAQDRVEVKNFLELVAKVGSGRQICRWVRKDGSLIVVDMVCTAEYDASLQLVEILVCAENITEREAANERVFFLSKILENLDDVVIVTDNQNKVEYVNLAAERLFLYSTREISAQPITRLFDESRLGDLMAQIKVIVDDGGIWQGDIPCLRQDGFGIAVSAKVSQLREPDGSPLAVIYTLRDITYQKQIILELRQSEDKYRTIFDQAPLSMLLMDARGNIMDINRWHIRHVDKLRRSRADYLARNVFNIKFFTDAGLTSQLRDLLRGESFEIAQARFETDASQQSLVMSVSGMPLYDDQRMVRGALLILEDITERYELQEQLWRHAVELEEKTRLALHSSRLKSEFLTNVSHELRTPLNAIIGFTRLVMKKNKALIADAQYRNLQHILDSAYHLLDLINSILDLSKIEAGRMDLHIERFSFPQFLDSVIKTAEPLMEKNNNLFIQKVDPAIQYVNNDITKLRQVIINLLSNAAKFTTQGTIILKASQIESPRDGFSPMLKLEISDSGIGIPEEKINDIFEAFRQADGSTTRQFGGTGLGLTLTKRFCILMRGNISATSIQGKGSTFTIVIPIDYERAETYNVVPAAKESPVYDRELPPVDREVVLLLNDDPDLMQQLRRNFNNDRIILTGASSYVEALNKTQYLLPSLIFLDPWIDEEQVWRLIRTLKTQRHTWSIPIALLSDSHHESWSIFPNFDVVFKPVSDTRFHNLCDSIQSMNNPRVLVVDDDVEFLNQAAESFMAQQLAFDIARTLDEAYQSSVKTQPGVLMISLSNFGSKDHASLKELMDIKSIASIVLVAWQRMNAEEFNSTIQNLKFLVNLCSVSHSTFQSSIPAQIVSAEDLFETFRIITAAPIQQ